MSAKRRPLLHSKSLYKPPLARSSQSSPGPNPLYSSRSPIFSPSSSRSHSSDPHINQNPKPDQKGHRSYSMSMSSRRSTLKFRSQSMSTQSQRKSDKKSNIGSMSEQFSAFINVSSQVKISDGANGGPLSRVCPRLTLHSAPH